MGDQDERHAVPARKHLLALGRLERAYGPADHGDNGATGQGHDRLDILEPPRHAIEHDVEIDAMRLIDLCFPLPMHANDIHPVNVAGVVLSHGGFIGRVPRGGVRVAPEDLPSKLNQLLSFALILRPPLGRKLMSLP